MRDRESGIAWGLFMIVLFFICAGLFLVMMAPMINPITTEFNRHISQGEISQQTANAYQWTESFFRYGITLAVIVGGLLFAVVRALYRRKADQYG